MGSSNLILILSITVTVAVAVMILEPEDKQVSEAYFLLQATEDRGPRLLIVEFAQALGDGIGSCEFIEETKDIEQQLKSADADQIHEINEAELVDLFVECEKANINSLQTGYNKPDPMNPKTPMAKPKDKSTGEGYSGWNVITPGTKWCGAGDIAKDYDDLGVHADTDRCCRAHDLCDDMLAPGARKNNLTNTSPFTTLSCQCDDEFYKCLSRVDSFVSNKIGNLYFNILKRRCYEYNYPVTKKCKTFRSFLRITCKEYARNTNAPKTLRWRPAKHYKKLPIPGPFSFELNI